MNIKIIIFSKTQKETQVNHKETLTVNEFISGNRVIRQDNCLWFLDESKGGEGCIAADSAGVTSC